VFVEVAHGVGEGGEHDDFVRRGVLEQPTQQVEFGVVLGAKTAKRVPNCLQTGQISGNGVPVLGTKVLDWLNDGLVQGFGNPASEGGFVEILCGCFPKRLAAITALYERRDWRVFASVADVASVYSGFSRKVRLPAYTLVNAGLRFDGRRWSATVSGKNLTNERYFRANFPNLFGGVVVLPELPRHFHATVAWKF